MASAAVGITRAPKSLTKASFNDLVSIAETAPQSGKQLAAWNEIDGVLKGQLGLEPTGWWEWTLAMRNSQIHRPRQLTVYLADESLTKVTGLVLPPSAAKAVGGLIKFSMHLRKLPGVPDMQSFATTGHLSELILPEKAQDTLRAILDRVNDLIEELAGLLHAQWMAIEGSADGFEAPITKWKLANDSNPFQGTYPSAKHINMDIGVTNPSDVKRFQIGEALRKLNANGG